MVQEAGGAERSSDALADARECGAGPDTGALRRLRQGECLGRFEIVRALPSSDAAPVYAAHDRMLCRDVALKLVHAEDRRALVGEAEALAALGHPAIVTFHELGFSPAGDFLVLELLEGETLADRLRRGSLPLRQALRIALDVARALEHAHARGVVFRNLAPSSVFLRSGGGAKVVDARMAGLHGSPPVRRESSSCSAPEQLDGLDGDERSDVYAAAATLLASLGVTPTREAGSSPALRELPRPLRRLLREALSPDPDRRPLTGRDWLTRLDAVQRRLASWRRAAALGGAMTAAIAIALAFRAFTELRQEQDEQEARELATQADAACEAGQRALCVELHQRLAQLRTARAQR